jgi:hypothetical protein
MLSHSPDVPSDHASTVLVSSVFVLEISMKLVCSSLSVVLVSSAYVVLVNKFFGGCSGGGD